MRLHVSLYYGEGKFTVPRHPTRLCTVQWARCFGTFELFFLMLLCTTVMKADSQCRSGRMYMYVLQSTVVLQGIPQPPSPGLDEPCKPVQHCMFNHPHFRHEQQL